MSASPRLPGGALIFAYRKLSNVFQAVAQRTFADKNIFCGYYPCVGDIDIKPRFYHYYKRNSFNNDLSDHDYHEIIGRDRVLRNLPWDQSRQMVDAMYCVVDELTDRKGISCLLTLMVDCYCVDLLARLCAKKGISVASIVSGNTNNALIVNSYGEFNYTRDPSEQEIDRELATLLDNGQRVTYSAKVNQHTVLRQARMSASWWARRAYFSGYSLLNKDPLNFRRLVNENTALSGESDPFGYRCLNFFDSSWEQKLKQSDKPVVLIPLSFSPEATTDYWLSDKRIIDYENFIVNTAISLRDTHLVAIKEHWAALGYRHWRFYERISKLSGVVVVPASENSRHVMSFADVVLVGAGTAGVEAAIRGKKVVTLDYAHYHLDQAYLPVNGSSSISELPRLLKEFQPTPNTPEQQREILRALLRSTMVGHLRIDKKLNTEENYQTIANSLTEYLTTRDAHRTNVHRVLESRRQRAIDELARQSYGELNGKSQIGAFRNAA